MVKWLRQTAHDQEVVSSNPDTVYRIDASYYIKEKLKIKVAKWGTMRYHNAPPPQKKKESLQRS